MSQQNAKKEEGAKTFLSTLLGGINTKSIREDVDKIADSVTSVSKYVILLADKIVLVVAALSELTKTVNEHTLMIEALSTLQDNLAKKISYDSTKSTLPKVSEKLKKMN